MTRRFARPRASLWTAAVAVAGLSTTSAMMANRTNDMQAATVSSSEVKVSVNEADRRADVTIDGKPFTSYLWPTSLKKPVLHPISTAAGVVVTRGFPPAAGERADHPHHVGLWFNYGDVNGFDFWNNSDAIKPENAAKYGTVVHKAVTRHESGKGKAALGVKADWVTGKGETVLQEETTFSFEAREGVRVIDRMTTLRPTAGKVTFTDNKEGMLGLRVIRALEDPNEKSGEFRDAAGNVTKMKNMDTAGVTGVYTSSEGKKGGEVWGTRGRWTMLAGQVNGKPVTVAILDHPSNPGFPTYWHARGYGLFAANPLGQAAFTEGKEKLGFAIDAGKSQLFRYRVLLFDAAPTPSEVEQFYTEWAAAKS